MLPLLANTSSISLAIQVVQINAAATSGSSAAVHSNVFYEGVRVASVPIIASFGPTIVHYDPFEKDDSDVRSNQTQGFVLKSSEQEHSASKASLIYVRFTGAKNGKKIAEYTGIRIRNSEKYLVENVSLQELLKQKSEWNSEIVLSYSANAIDYYVIAATLSIVPHIEIHDAEIE